MTEVKDSGADLYLSLQTAMRDGQNLIGSMEGVEFELKTGTRYRILELKLPDEVDDWYKNVQVKGLMKKLHDAYKVTGYNRKIVAKTKDGQQLAPMAEFLVTNDDLLIDQDGVFKMGLFKGFIDTSGKFVVGREDGTHNDILRRHSLGEIVGTFHTTLGTLSVDINEQFPVETGGVAVAARLLRLGMKEGDKLYIYGKMGEFGQIIWKGNLGGLVMGIRVEDVNSFVANQILTDFKGETVSVGVGRYLGEVGGDDWLIRGVDTRNRIYTLANDRGETKQITYDQIQMGIETGEWEFIGVRKPYCVERSLESWRIYEEIVGIVTADRILWSKEAPDHASLVRTAMIPKSEMFGTIQFKLPDRIWIIGGTTRAVEMAQAVLSDQSKINPEFAKTKTVVSIVD